MTADPAVRKIISGGQTGVDRAALDVALELGIPCGGWCPRGRRAKDGPIDRRYPLQETETGDYLERTRLNVLDADATLVLNVGALAGGTGYTAQFARDRGRPFLVVQLDDSPDVQQVLDWLKLHRVQVLNVAGPREKDPPVVHRLASAFLHRLLEQGYTV